MRSCTTCRSTSRRRGADLSTRTTADLRTGYASEGPGLALILLVVAAGAAALLALGRAVLALYAAARRRLRESSA
ncbi:hypothetical protein [Microbispora catharanthi]|uniref:Uncharacterized protein n=1 Tax=Microbispora catharanthi TaxID=1712871 RepID=A0A5N6BWN5_9ACTN|nr:hypothetical protein [Microbispora catharanthi]KAB8184895.1 hypothetical protein FH610_013360 [Microbispora catharanthi]